MVAVSKNDDFATIPPLLGIGFVAVTTLIMAYSHLVSVIPILAMYAMWFPFLYYKKDFTLRPSIDIALPLVFAGYCIASSVWSDYPSKSLYSSIQYLSMILCSIIIARRLSFDNFLKGISLGVFLVLICTFHTGTFSFQGLFGSKNQVGFFAEVGILVSLLLLFSSQQTFFQKIFFAILPLIISLTCLGLSHSASSVISTSTVLAICCVGLLIGKLSRPKRPILLSLILLGGVTIGFGLYAFDINPQAEILTFFGKDSTLTGRTDLWQEGLSNFTKNPILGNGYLAFWIEGRPEAEELWEKFYIPDKTGFHFHNLFIQTMVDLGIVGLFILLASIATFLMRSISSLICNGATLYTIFPLALALMFLTRSFVEVDILNAFGIGPLLFFSMYPRIYNGQTKHIGDTGVSNGR